VSLTDCHAHLCDPAFEPDLESVLERARAAGIAAVVAVGETVADARANLALARRYPGFVRPAAGLFPTYLDLTAAAEMEALIREQRAHLAAIGEVGLDHWKVCDPGEQELQRAIFTRFIDLAQALDLPLNVHSRSAGRATVELLLARGARRVQLHAFDGRAATALPGVEAGYFFSIPPSVVRSHQKQRLVRRLPLACLLLESDSPVLGPDPAGRNEPANVGVALRAIAEIQQVPVESVREAVEENARRLYP
jgi:TatD DNase family protein